MNKKDILEIKKQFKKDNNIIGKILTCYIDGEKNIKMTQKENFSILQEEDAFKYQEIFKKSLSGSIGKNLLNLELDIYKNKEKTDILYELKESKLDDEDIIEIFLTKLIEAYDYNENYLIILINITYDIPRKTKDNILLADASEEVYNAILCSICPIKLDKAYLRYNPNKQVIENKIRDLVVEAPIQAFLYPSFNNRSMDIHQALYFTKNPNDIKSSFINDIFAVNPPLGFKEQRESISDSINEFSDIKFDNITKMHMQINERLQNHDDEEGPLVLDKKDMIDILEKSDIEAEDLELYEKNTDDDLRVLANNIIDTKKLELKNPYIDIKVDSEHMHLLSTKYIDNKKYIMIEVNDNIEINGIKIKKI